MPATYSSALTTPEEMAAWKSLEAAEEALESALQTMPSTMPEVCGTIYYLDEQRRLVSAPACIDGSPDRFNERHRSEYEGMCAEDMNQIAAEILAWLRAQPCAAGA